MTKRVNRKKFVTKSYLQRPDSLGTVNAQEQYLTRQLHLGQIDQIEYDHAMHVLREAERPPSAQKETSQNSTDNRNQKITARIEFMFDILMPSGYAENAMGDIKEILSSKRDLAEAKATRRWQIKQLLWPIAPLLLRKLVAALGEVIGKMIS